MQQNIALFGAAGAIGRSIAEALRKRGAAYRVVGRNKQRLEDEFGQDPLARIVTWNPDDAESVARRRAASTLSSIWLACPTTISNCIRN